VTTLYCATPGTIFLFQYYLAVPGLGHTANFRLSGAENFAHEWWSVMARVNGSKFRTGFVPEQARHLFGVAELKARQSAKIRELREALVAAGYASLDEQAKVLGLSRSTAWTIVNGRHKGSGLSATIVNRMLLSPRLPSLARTKILEYIEERSAGHYGHANVRRLRKFSERLHACRQPPLTRCGAGNEFAFVENG
jgi:hypothetical protein